MPEGAIDTQIQGGIARLSFHHPKGNALPGALLEALTAAIREWGADQQVKVIVLQSRGDGAFCAGAYFDALRAIRDFDAAKAFFMGFAHLLNTLRECPKFVLGRVQGKAVGGGVGLLAATDYTLAVESASVRLSELALGIGPFVIEPAIRRRIGTSAMSAMTIDASSWKTASWALERGLYHSLHPDTAALDQALDQLAQSLSEKSPAAMRALKALFWAGTADWPELMEERAALSGELLLSDYTQAVLKA